MKKGFLILGILLSWNFLIIGIALSEPVIFFDEDVSKYNGNDVPRIDYPKSTTVSKKFFKNLNKTNVESFESFEPDEHLPITINFGDAGNATLKGETNQIYKIEDPKKTHSGTFPTSGNNYLLSLGDFYIEFEKEQSAFGFFITDLEINSAKLIFENTKGEAKSFHIPYTRPSKSGSVAFWGIIDTEFSFNKVTFAGQNNKDGFGFDDFIIGTKEQLSYISGCIAVKDNPLSQGKVMLMQSGEIFQSIQLDKNGCYKFYDYNESKPFSVVIRKSDN